MTAPAKTIRLAEPAASTDEYSIVQYSSHDLDAVHSLAVTVAQSDAFPKFLLAQLADILDAGFLVAWFDDGDVRRAAGYIVVAPHAQLTHRGVVLALTVSPEHERARQRLLDAATSFLHGRGCDDITFAESAAPPAALEAVTGGPVTADVLGQYTVRKFRPTDLDDVFRVECSAFGDDPYPRTFFRRLADVLGDGFLVAEGVTASGRQVVGYLLAVLDGGVEERGWVMSVAVHHLHRNRHVGTQLMAAAEYYFEACKRKEVLLTVDPDNEVAVELYKHRHYDEIERHDDLHGMKLSRLVMRRLLRLPTR